MRTETHTPEDADRAPLDLRGVEIIARERAIARHPRSDSDYNLTGVTKLQLTTGADAYECNKCGRVRNTAQAIFGHLSAHFPRRPRYPQSTLRSVIAVRRAFAAGGRRRNVNEHSAEWLNERGVPTLDGRPWTAERVHSVYNVYRDKIRTVGRLPHVELGSGKKAWAGVGKAEIVGKPAAPIDQASPSAKLETLARELDALSKSMDTLVGELRALATDLGVPTIIETDPAVIEKAAKWDAYRRLMDS